jgi:trimeric autotransporter adhesin
LKISLSFISFDKEHNQSTKLNSMKNSILIVICLLFATHITAQNVGINETGAAPAASAILDVSAVNKGILVPRLPNHATIAAPATGLLVYNTTTNTFWYFNGVIWVEIVPGVAELVDLDQDTRVTVEWNPDEDIIRFFAASAVDQMRFNGKTLHFTSTNTFIGNTAGAPSTGANNTYLGYLSGTSSTSANHNTLMGSLSGTALTTGQFNLFLGSGAGQVATTSDGNVYLGYRSGFSNVVGTANTFAGFGAGYFATSSNNSLFGYRAGFGITSGDLNVYVGKEAGYSNTTGSSNVAMGHESGYSITTGTANTFTGYFAGRGGATTSNNSAFGSEAGRNLTTGFENSFFGSTAGLSTTSGRYNTFLGFQAGRDNTSANANTFIGWRCGFNNLVGFQNTFIGYSAGRSTFDGDDNVFMGHAAGDVCQFGNRNVLIGKSAGAVLGSGNDNVFLGKDAGLAAVNVNGCVLIGHRAGESVAVSNRLYIANGPAISQTLIYGEFDNTRLGIGTTAPTATLQLGLSGEGRTGLAEAWNVFSDARYKTDVVPLKNALNMVMEINGYYYRYINDKSQKQQVGVIAQELEEILPQIVATDAEGFKSVDYAKLTPVLIEAIKEQQEVIESLEARLAKMERRMIALENASNLNAGYHSVSEK